MDYKGTAADVLKIMKNSDFEAHKDKVCRGFVGPGNGARGGLSRERRGLAGSKGCLERRGPEPVPQIIAATLHLLYDPISL